MKIFLPLVFFLLAGVLQVPAQVKIVSWNLLNYPSTSATTADTTLRHPMYRTVVQHVDPDILVTEEMTTTAGAAWFLSEVMNAAGNQYSSGTFINGFDSDNAIYFRSSMFSFVSNVPIETDLRDINEFTLVHTASGDTLRLYAVHLKASAGAVYEAQRALEVDSLRNVTNLFPAGKNFIVCGDFNIYGTFESAYQKLILNNAGDDGHFVDPLVMPGTWNAFGYRSCHTQSTRTGSFGGGASGGMNDRFDMILFSNAISQGTSGMSYVPGSTQPIGNDGSHYNQSVNTLPNSAAPVAVLNALYSVSDHLPVLARFNFSGPSAVAQLATAVVFHAYPNPVKTDLILSGPVAPEMVEVADLSGRICISGIPGAVTGGYSLDLTSLAAGLYTASVWIPGRKITFLVVKE